MHFQTLSTDFMQCCKIIKTIKNQGKKLQCYEVKFICKTTLVKRILDVNNKGFIMYL